VGYVDAARFTAAGLGESIASPSTWTARPPCTQRQSCCREGDQDSSGVARCLAPSPRKWRKVPDRPTRAQCDIQGDDRLVSGNLGFKIRRGILGY